MEAPLHLPGGMSLDHDKERKIILLVSIGAFLLVVFSLLKARSAGSSTASDGSFTGSLGGATAGAGTTTDPNGNPTDLSALQAEIAALEGKSQKAIELSFTTDNGVTTGYNKGSSSTSSGGGFLSVLGLGSIGGSSGGSKTSGTTVAQQYADSFTTDIKATGLSTDELTGLEDWLSKMAGTQADRTASELAFGQGAFPYTSGGKTITTVNAPPPATGTATHTKGPTRV